MCCARRNQTVPSRFQPRSGIRPRRPEFVPVSTIASPVHWQPDAAHLDWAPIPDHRTRRLVMRQLAGRTRHRSFAALAITGGVATLIGTLVAARAPARDASRMHVGAIELKSAG